MAHPRATLKQSELTRYAKAFQAAGIVEWRVVVHPSGKYEIVAGKTDPAQAGPDPDDIL